ncbi:YceH family protein [Alicycliphilus denitrificans]|uniref:YceH family protein n=1 Tax=Alicycliphilus denitrificans TaxID=179636 RepID=UPI00384FF351
MPFDPRQRPLSAPEARVLATLLEKSRTVPDSYPLTLNSLLAGCNQKTSREPVMQLSDNDLLQALETLRQQTLVVEIGGARVARWEHNFERGIGVPMQAAALLGLLMLRGPQTAAELRLNAERWHRFADTSSVEAFLDELAERSEDKGGPLVTLLPRAPGARESRWAQLLCGPVDAQALQAASTSAGAPASPALQARVEALESEVAALRATVQRLCEQLGIPAEETVAP